MDILKTQKVYLNYKFDDFYLITPAAAKSATLWRQIGHLMLQRVWSILQLNGKILTKILELGNIETNFWLNENKMPLFRYLNATTGGKTTHREKRIISVLFLKFIIELFSFSYL